jgi:hypothetical protein
MVEAGHPVSEKLVASTIKHARAGHEPAPPPPRRAPPLPVLTAATVVSLIAERFASDPDGLRTAIRALTPEEWVRAYDLLATWKPPAAPGQQTGHSFSLNINLCETA